MPGCPEDRKRDGGRGGRGVVASRGDGRADKGPGEEAEKTGKDTYRKGENLALGAAPAKLQHLTANMASLFDFGAFCPNGDSLKLSPRL